MGIGDTKSSGFMRRRRGIVRKALSHRLKDHYFSVTHVITIYLNIHQVQKKSRHAPRSEPLQPSASGCVNKSIEPGGINR